MGCAKAENDIHVFIRLFVRVCEFTQLLLQGIDLFLKFWGLNHIVLCESIIKQFQEAVRIRSKTYGLVM